MSISKSGIVRNSPIKKDSLVKKKSIMKLFDGLKELKEKGYSNRKMGTQEYCKFLRTNIDSKKMNKIMDILDIKDYGLTMEEKAPYIMSPRSTNLLMYLFVDAQIKASLMWIFSVSTLSGAPLFQLFGLGGILGMMILGATDIINYFGGTTFFLKVSRAAQHSIRHQIFKVIDDDTRGY